MPATYDKVGLNFQYPENWQLTEDIDEMPRSVSVTSPDGAFWAVDLHPFSMDVETLLEQILAAMKSEYDDIEVDSIEDETCGEPTSGYALSFYCLDFLVAAEIRCFKHGHAVYVTTYQAEDRDYEKLAPVFSAITTSMLTEDAVS